MVPCVCAHSRGCKGSLAVLPCCASVCQRAHCKAWPLKRNEVLTACVCASAAEVVPSAAVLVVPIEPAQPLGGPPSVQMTSYVAQPPAASTSPGMQGSRAGPSSQ